MYYSNLGSITYRARAEYYNNKINARDRNRISELYFDHDFFFNEKTQTLYFNEVNTMPGFTAISLYPSMWAKSGKNYSQLLASLIETAIFQHDARKNLMTDYHD